MKLRPIDIGIILLTLTTAAIHFTLGQPLFILNGLGYLALLAAFYLPWAPLQQYHKLIRWAFAGYTLVTIILYFVFNSDGAWQSNTMGLITKGIEVVLLLLLLYDSRAGSTVDKPAP